MLALSPHFRKEGALVRVNRKPLIQGFAIVELRTRFPFIIGRTEAKPTNKVTPTTATAFLINNGVNEIFFDAIFSDYGARGTIMR